MERNADGLLTGATLEHSDVTVQVRKGDRIIQMSPFRADTERTITVVDQLSESARDIRGFGSTGN